MAEKFDEFLEEVQNDIRQDKYITLWRRYGKLATNIIVGILVLVAAYTLWSNHEYKKRQIASDKYAAAQQLIIQGNPDQAQTLLKELADESVKIYPTLSKFVLAGVLLEKNTDEAAAEAQSLYEQLASSATEPLWRDFARYQLLSVRLNRAATIDEAFVAELKKFASESNALSPLAQELLGIALLKSGNKTEASEVFVKLAQSPEAPEGVVMRAQLVTQILLTQS